MDRRFRLRYDALPLRKGAGSNRMRFLHHLRGSDMADKTWLKPIRRTITAVFYAAIAAGLIWLAITRWNGVPADPSGGGLAGSPSPLHIDPKWDRTAELTAALAGLPPVPNLVLPPPPPGMRWDKARLARGPIMPTDILHGEWTPETRPHLQAVVTFLATPAVHAALEQLAAIERGGCRMNWHRWVEISRAAKLFIARARYRHAGLGDLDGALADLETVYRLASTLLDSGEILLVRAGLGYAGLADEELRQLAHEQALAREHTARVLEILHKTPLNKHDLWQYVTAGECGVLERLLDMSYTDDGHGNGWLVLSHLDNMPRIRTSQPRCGVWNMLSPLFNNRHAVAAKISRARSASEKVGDLPYGAARAAAEACDAHVRFSVLDGPIGLGMTGPVIAMYHQDVVRHLASRNATIAAVALSAHRRDQGKYPLSLEELLGDYLDAMPLDPYVDEPLHYIQRQDGDDYLLYAVGPNQIDDGGKQPTKAARIRPSERDGDVDFRHTRRDASREPKLEAVKQ